MVVFLYFKASNTIRPAAATPPTVNMVVIGEVDGVGGISGAYRISGLASGMAGARPSPGIADGDTATGCPHDAPEASEGAARISVSVSGGVVGQPGE